MKRLFWPIVIALFVVVIPSLAIAHPGGTDVTSLSNKDILLMVQNHLSEEAIINSIKSSPCTFDTFPPVLRDMKRRGVPEAVLEAMVQAPYGPALRNSSRDDLGPQAIYHYADQLKQLGYIIPSRIGGGNTQFPRQSVRRTSGRTRGN